MKYVKYLLALFFFCLVLVAGLFMYLHTTILLTPEPVKSYVINEIKLTSLVNNWRSNHNLQSLTTSEKLCDLAKIRVYEIRYDWSHKGFDPAVKRLAFYGSFGENLGKGSYDEQSLLSSWESSPEHLKNLSGDYKYQCVATVYDGNQNFVVQEFANF